MKSKNYFIFMEILFPKNKKYIEKKLGFYFKKMSFMKIKSKIFLIRKNIKKIS